MTSDELFFNRELSWLQFNARVLHEAMDVRTPLLERVRFLQIFTNNLDEFFMKRVGGIKRQEAFGVDSQSGLQKGLIKEIRKNLIPILKSRSECWLEDISPALEREGILLLSWADLNSQEQEKLERYFDQKLFGTLTPLTVDPGHPFPFISNLSASLGVVLKAPQPKQNKEIFARVKIPTNYPSWIQIGDSTAELGAIKLISLRDVIHQFFFRLFPGLEIMGSVFFRLTRNADLDHGEEDMEDLLESIAEQLKARRFAQVVRLEHVTTANVSMIEMLKAELGLQQADIYEQAVDLDFSVLNPIWELGHKQLRYRSWVPVVSEALKDEKVSIFSVIRNQDILVHHPYESFSQSVERFVSAAVNDRHVLAIKMVLYRTGVDSPFITHLIRAAELGKQVVCIVELKARFDEESNIQVARRLERAGVHVVYGVVGLKTHCKVTLVVRAEGEQVRSYAHISTGNYNVNTAEVYTDLGLFTANPVLTRDTIQLFHYLTGGSPETHFEKLVLGPLHMKQKFFDLIEFERSQAEQGRPARIMAKMNSLEDPEVIQSLYLASQAGVKISLIVRGFCCLKPGVAGLSENISVVSVVGRFLEHSRVFYFQNGQSTFEEGVLLMGSADWMLRNLNSRVEILAPIEAIDIKRRILELFKLMLEDQRQAWDLLPDGSYIQRRPGSISEEEGVHDRLMKVYATLESLAIR